ncbi:hypothetical protein M409DRAFT_21383 [Zasmidium cellare ATCC 36951]|uniref:Uncharacterized protein n=1 Tax=Zasmidium cellare ATCC 36951 TaxID=1080233 RepID=A0A6A6CR40_ZASCE|nr:uncharacterized protein M409DRAFT_21383 [Zasmidium cellare ATCC 36951]KAF2168638.1 hypothetical protein M409DRAFT_21383 [Zasmidium cellare ATCC 36951]
MTNSDVSESKPERNLSPLPLFADRVRNALESQRSGISTPVLDNHSPPTPDPSPPGVRQTLSPPRPPLSHSPSSFADSFKTAHEGLSASGNVSREHSPFEDEPSQQQKSWLHATMPVRLDGLGLLGDEPVRVNDTSSEEHVRVKDYQLSSPEQNYESDKSEVRAKNYVLSGSEKNEESDRGEVRVKNYQMESDSDLEPQNANASSSPTFRKALDHHMAQHRLRKPIQPGDDAKRPNEALLYSSLGTWKGRKALTTPQTPPRREKDTTFLRNADLVPPQTPESLIDLSPQTPEEEPETPRQRKKSADKPNGTPKKLREFAPSASPAMMSPPNTATKERSLEENNNVYRMIQEENAKRHSAISDGSVQAKVVLMPESKKKLRHSRKRDSLRGDVSMASNSKRSSSESGQKLKHKRAMDSLGGSEVTPDVTPERNDGGLKFSSRISRFDPGQNGFDYWSALPDEDYVQETPVEAEPAAGPALEPAFKPRRLRRSLRERSLDKQPSSGPRPWSMDGQSLTLDQSQSISPKLRRSSAEKRLDRNDDVRRNSIIREPQTMSQKLDRVAQDLTREGHEISDHSSLTDRRRSSEKQPLSPRRKGFDPHALRPMGTPLSTSQFSDRTGMTEAEIGEARGVQFFPHNNDSLLLIQESSLPVGALDALGNEALDESDETERNTPNPVFQAFVDAPEDSAGEKERSKHTVDSPLTNPRAAPEPPVIKFIPPTPSEELERALGGDAANERQGDENTKPSMPRRMSLTQKMRRYSDAVFQPLPFGRSGSVRKSQAKRATISEPRPTHLSSFWQPRDFWEEYDSEEEYEDDGPDALPPGGDTSNIPDKKRSLLPRNMSVRMPGFRGTGGFLVGNSLGLDRHGTNKRRHYIDKRTSEEMLRRLAEQRRRRTFPLPFSGGARVEYVGLNGLGTRMRESRKRRQERALEKRREKLRGQIGTRMYHDGGRCGVP